VKVERAARRAALSLEERDAAIVAAHEAGFTLRQIAVAAGLTNPRIHQIIRKEQRERLGR
jgi:predicted transcriptional regulator